MSSYYSHREMRNWIEGDAPDLFVDAVMTNETTVRMHEAVARSTSRTWPATNFSGALFETGHFKGAVFDGPVNFTGTRWFGPVDFSQATFNEGVRFAGATFMNTADFSGSSYVSQADWRGIRSMHALNMSHTKWLTASFSRSRLAGDVDFEDAHFSSEADFMWTKFGGEASFIDATFDNWAIFSGSQFDDRARFNRTRFDGLTNFAACKFSGHASFDLMRSTAPFYMSQCYFGEYTHFSRVTCEAHTEIESIITKSNFVMDRSRFASNAIVEVMSPDCLIVDCSFERGGRISFARSRVTLADCRFGGQTLIEGSGTFAEELALADQPIERRQNPELSSAVVAHWTAKWRGENAPNHVQLVKLDGSDVDNVTLANIDLSRCKFQSVHRLDQIRIETTCTWRRTRSSILGASRMILPGELAWSATRAGHGRLRTSTQPIPGASGLAGIYRSLREAFEKHSDQPGASDFYYGEMQARRHSDRAPFGERCIVALYWLTAGYGLRATRALGALALFMAVASGAFVGFGGTGASYPHAAILLSRSATGLGGTTIRDLHPSSAGLVIELVTRLTVPVLLGLTALSIRGRVRR